MNLILSALLVVWVAAAVVAPSTQVLALGIAGFFTLSGPLWMKYIPWTGAQMTAFTMLVAFGISALAAWLTGDLTLDRAGLLTVLSGTGSVWIVQQIVYAALKQWVPTSVGAQTKAPSLPGSPAIGTIAKAPPA